MDVIFAVKDWSPNYISSFPVPPLFPLPCIIFLCMQTGGNNSLVQLSGMNVAIIAANSSRLSMIVLHFWDLLFSNVVSCLGYRSNNFIVGLTNTHPSVQATVLWQYTLCDQYHGTVPDGATVSVQCTHAYMSGLRFQYVIVQFPLVNDSMNICEIEVFILGKTVVIIWKSRIHAYTQS